MLGGSGPVRFAPARRRAILDRPWVQNVLIGAALAVSAYMLAPPISPVLRTARIPLLRTRPPRTVETLLAGPLPPHYRPKRRPPPVGAKGVLVSGYSAGGSNLERIIRLVRSTELDAVVIDVKDERGEISWMPRSPETRLVAAGLPKILDPARVLRRLHRFGIYVIGRVAVFRDPILARARPDLAVQNVHGGVWRDTMGEAWVDPYATEAQDYDIAVAAEAVELGFDEIQFDDLVLPAEAADPSRVWHRYADGRPLSEAVAAFLDRARAQLVPRGAYVSAVLPGPDVLGGGPPPATIGLEALARRVDYVSLTLFPSEFPPGAFGLADPERQPYKLVHRALADATRRLAPTGSRLRPWLQDFSRRVPYTPVEVRAEIDACEDAGVHQWLLWSPANHYSSDALRVPPNVKVPPPEESPAIAPEALACLACPLARSHLIRRKDETS